MEITGLDLTTFSITPTVLQTQGAILNEVPASLPRDACFPYFPQHYIYTENAECKGNNEEFEILAAKDILYDQIVQIDTFDGEAIQKYSEPSDWSTGVTMQVLDSGEQASAQEKVERAASTSRNTTSSPKTSRKLPDSRRRREKANEREKQRIVVLKNAMNVLKNAIPAAREKRKITKLEVLQLARDYINSLRAQLTDDPFESSSEADSGLFVYCNSAPLEFIKQTMVQGQVD